MAFGKINLKDYFLLILRNFSRRKLRGMLTILGIFIGIMAVVALVSLTQGMQDAITTQFEKLGTNRITVTAGGTNLGPLGSELTTAKLTDKDIEVIKRVSGVENVFGVLVQTARVDFRKETKYLSIFGVPTDPETRTVLDEISFLLIDRGRSVRAGDKFKADVGYKFATDLFDKAVTVGDTLTISGQEFEVIGTRKQAGTGIHDSMIKIPLDTARVMYNEPEKYSMVFVVAKEDIDMDKLAEEIKKDLRKERNVAEGEEDFMVQTSQQAISTFTQILAVVQIILVGIAALSLIIGGVGIMNTMYTAVLERTREIGIMKALGAKSSQILTLFLIESGIIGLLGGIIGLFLGIGVGKIAQFIASYYGITLVPAISLWLIIVALVFSFSVGILSGALPAIQASRLRPIEAIRRY